MRGGLWFCKQLGKHGHFTITNTWGLRLKMLYKHVERVGHHDDGRRQPLLLELGGALEHSVPRLPSTSSARSRRFLATYHHRHLPPDAVGIDLLLYRTRHGQVSNGDKIFTAGLACPDPTFSPYGVLHGPLVVGTRGVLWEYEVYEESSISYIPMALRMFLMQKCTSRSSLRQSSRRLPLLESLDVHYPPEIKKGGKIISGLVQGSLIQLARIGYDAERGFVSTGVDPSWRVLPGDLEAHGVEDFVRDAQKAPPP
ncbi:hypothetical protein PENSPDRAFT_753663 [Peniophora sp. CONT]|nr:hypothetical protein PENSPDRAFT_753663 [Peniophora sp. CONT]